jgi:hypothetical protein
MFEPDQAGGERRDRASAQGCSVAHGKSDRFDALVVAELAPTDSHPLGRSVPEGLISRLRDAGFDLTVPQGVPHSPLRRSGFHS